MNFLSFFTRDVKFVKDGQEVMYLDADDITIETWSSLDDLESVTYATCLEGEDGEIGEVTTTVVKMTPSKKFICYLLAGVFSMANNLSYKRICTKYEKEIKNILKEKKMPIKGYEIIKKNMEQYEEILDEVRELYENSKVEDLRGLVEKHFFPTKDEKEKNAEIHTTRVLVNDMISKVPKDFWTKINTVFEPCCGKGNFVLALIEKFFEGLEKTIPNKKKRCKIIMTKCIYFADLTYLNVYITKELAKAHIKKLCGVLPDYEFNTNVGDSLDLDIKKKWKLKGFNEVVMNAPYSKQSNWTTKRVQGEILWNKFVKKSIEEWLIDDGYLLTVHPSGWRKPDSLRSKYHMFDFMVKENQMLYLEIHNAKDGMKTFDCATRYDWYLLEKKTKYKNTEVLDEKGIMNKIDMSKWKWLPNFHFDKIKSCFAMENEDKCDFLYERTNYGTDKKWTSAKESKVFKYPCIHSTTKKGTKYYYSEYNNKGFFGVSKVIFGATGIHKAVLDDKGEFGITDNAMGIVDTKENLTKIKKAVESEQFKVLLEACSWGLYRIDWRMFISFKKDFWKEFV